MPPDAGPGTRVARRGRGVPPRPRAADADGGLCAAEPVRRLPRGAVCTLEAGLRPVAAHEVSVVRRARRAWLSRSRGASGQEPARHARGRALVRSLVPRRARAARRRRAAAAPGRGGPVGARGRASRARPRAQGAEADAGSARALRGARLPERRVRGAAPAHEPALALGSALSGGGAGGGLDELVVRAVGAVVLAPEAEVPRWFAWWEDGLVQRLVEDGRLASPEPGWLAAS